jgi:hypothetical protein
MSSDAAEKQVHITRLIADLRTAKVELLSAQCAADRLRLRYSPQDIVSLGERQTLERAIASVRALSRYFSQRLKPSSGNTNKRAPSKQSTLLTHSCNCSTRAKMLDFTSPRG